MDERGAKGYWRVGPIYVRRELVLLSVSAASLAVLAVFGLPLGLFQTPDTGIPAYRYDDGRLTEISDVVRVLDAQGRVRYEGEVEQGACTGWGSVFDEAGRLVYEGPLADGVYEGPDARVYREGILVYTGEMADGVYEGRGRRVDPATGAASEGEFVQGVLEGEGREYSPGGVLLREGAFSRDRLEGQGMEYSREGVLLREGSFSGGVLHGDGLEYTESGALRYEGQFRRGVYHGQGTLYDTLLGVPLYQGGFVDGEPLGAGTIFHPSGQVLYTGQVCGASPRADAFLGLSLAQVEAAFTTHWLLYSWEGVTAFVYPYFRLMFITESPVKLISPSAQEEQSQRERQELLAVLTAGADGGPAEAAAPEAAGSPAAPEEPVTDEVLDPNTDKGAVIISQVLSYGRALPGAAQPDLETVTGVHAAGWREWFSGYAMGWALQGGSVRQTGALVYRFAAKDGADGITVEEFRTQGAGLETLTALAEGKEMSLWYQTAQWVQEP